MEKTSQVERSHNLAQCSQFATGTLRLWVHRYKTRRQLHSLLVGDPRRLHDDLGLSTKAALAEINKPFWRG